MINYLKKNNILLIVIFVISLSFNLHEVFSIVNFYFVESMINKNFLLKHPDLKQSDFENLKESTRSYQLSKLFLFNLLKDDGLDTIFIQRFFTLYGKSLFDNITSFYLKTEGKVMNNEKVDAVYIIEEPPYICIFQGQQVILFDDEKKYPYKKRLNEILYEQFKFKGFE